MKCPNCKVEMERGRLSGHGGVWTKTPMNSTTWMDKVLFRGVKAIAYRCPSCKNIQLKSED